MKVRKKDHISINDFDKLDIRTGTIISAGENPHVSRPAYILKIDFGPYGIKKTSAQLTQRYRPEELMNKQIVAVLNFPKKQIGKMMSECLVLGVINKSGEVILINPDPVTGNGLKIR